jgi:PadR family transcriptional regulator, regulatory protein AphA
VAAKELTTTSYAILGLLALRSWSAYELAQQMARSFRHIWPRAESAIYLEPKQLVARGLARSRSEQAGGRSRTTYTITAKGRRALAAWLEGESAPPQLESEAMVRLMFAEFGSKEAALASIRSVRRFAEERNAFFLDQIGSYFPDGGQFPERLHVISLMGRCMHEYLDGLLRWAEWAEAEVERWPGTGTEASARGLDNLREIQRRFGAGMGARPRG